MVPQILVVPTYYVVRVIPNRLIVVLVPLLLLAGCGARTTQADPGPTEAVTSPVTPSPAGSTAPVTPSPSAAPTPTATDVSRFHVGKVSLQVTGFWSWAFLDFRSGKLAGSAPPNAVTDTASMTKAWIAADYLRRAAEQGRRPSETILSEITSMIRDSDNTHAYELHVANGNLASIQREIKLCGLSDTEGHQNSWSLTEMSARDVARLAKCIADGRAAGPKWTAWLLNEMRSVRGAGRFGVIEALPAGMARGTAIKNGWLERDDGLWHMACMATGDGWSIGIMMRFPGRLGRDYGAKTCREVTAQLLGA
jgi:hypothetical protein